MNIVLLSASADLTNGWGRFTCGLASAFASAGCNVDLMLPRGERAEAAPGGAQVRDTLPPLDLRFRRHDVALRAVVARLPELSRAEVGFLYCVDAFPMALFGRRLAARASCPLIVGAQGTYSVAPLDGGVARKVVRRALSSAQVVTAPSRRTAEALRTRGSIEPLTLANPIDAGRFAAPTAFATATTRDRPFVLSVAPAKPRKGLDVSIAAYARVAESFPDLDYVIVGSQPARNAVTELPSKLGVSDRVHFVGRVSDEELRAAYQACEVFIHTPREVDGNFEGFGLVYLEAGACGRPVLAARSGGVEDAVRDQETGLIVPEGDVDATATALRRLLSDAELRQRLGAGGQAFAHSITWPAYVETLFEQIGVRAEN